MKILIYKKINLQKSYIRFTLNIRLLENNIKHMNLLQQIKIIYSNVILFFIFL